MKTLTKEQALKLVGDLASASAHHVKVVNGMARGSGRVAAEKEVKAATRLLAALTSEPLSAEDLLTALGW